ncbi:MAG: class I SAM-dependent methyltransferase [Halorhabdus sp.]
MRRFDAEYLTRTREGMWDGPREALSALALSDRERVLDVGCGTGELTQVLREESPGEVVGCDADPALLAHADPPVVAGDAYRLPFPDDTFDLVVCQALLINLQEPTAALAEFARVSRDAVAAIEPDNAAVDVESTVPTEVTVEAAARRHYLDGVGTNVELGADARDRFESAGIEVVATARHDHDRTIEPPYDGDALEAARRKASGEGLSEDRATMLAGGLDQEAYDRLRAAWREMGRTVVEQMQAEAYERRETVPFYVTVGQI